MSGSGKSFTRRSVAIGGGVAAALGITALAVTGPRLFGYRKTPYDDLLSHLTDRDAAIQVGHAVIGSATLDPRETAADLRKRFANGTSLSAIIAADLESSRLAEAKGWVLPKSLAQLCALAAST